MDAGKGRSTGWISLISRTRTELAHVQFPQAASSNVCAQFCHMKAALLLALLLAAGAALRGA